MKNKTERVRERISSPRKGLTQEGAEGESRSLTGRQTVRIEKNITGVLKQKRGVEVPTSKGTILNVDGVGDLTTVYTTLEKIKGNKKKTCATWALCP